MQPLWAQMDSLMTVLTIPRLGAERADRQYRMATLPAPARVWRHGSDWPVSSGAPLEGIAVGVSRRTADGDPTADGPRTRSCRSNVRCRPIPPAVAYQAFAENRWGTNHSRRQRRPGMAGPRSPHHPRPQPARDHRARHVPARSASLPGVEGERHPMTTPTNSPIPGPLLEEPDGHLRRALGLPSLVLFGLVYIVPLTVFTTYGIVTETTGGRLPVAYVVTLVAMVYHRAVLRSDGRSPSRSPGRRTPTRRRPSARHSAFSPGGRCCWTICSCRCSTTWSSASIWRRRSRTSPAWVFILAAIAHRHGAQHRRHRVGGAGQLPHHRRPDRSSSSPSW